MCGVPILDIISGIFFSICDNTDKVLSNYSVEEYKTIASLVPNCALQLTLK